jgi:hypothetical protein
MNIEIIQKKHINRLLNKSIDDLEEILRSLDKNQRKTDCKFEFEAYLRKRKFYIDIIKIKKNG